MYLQKYTALLIVIYLLSPNLIVAQFPNATLFNTASNATGNGTVALFSNDLNWTAALTSSLGTYSPAVACGNQATCCWSNPTGPNANWITYPHSCSTSPAEHSCLGNIDVFYKLTFSLPATVCNSVSISTPSAYCLSIGFIADNCVWAVYVNGVSNYNSIVSIPYGYTGFLSTNQVNVNLCNNWQPGTNTVIVHVKSGAPSFPGWEGFMALVNQTLTTTTSLALSASVASKSVTCFGGATGSATITPLSGPGSYSYLWYPTGATSSVVSNLSAGTYTYLVSRPGYCPLTSTLTIPQPGTAITTSILASTNTACPGTPVSLYAQAQGGASPYSYSWIGGPNSATYVTTQNLSGSYTNTVVSTDALGCTQTSTISLVYLNTYSAAITTSNTSCYGLTNGGASLSAFPLLATTNYSWFPQGGSQPTSAGLAPGNYSFSIFGPSLCAFSSTFSILQPPAISLNISPPTTSLCSGNSITLGAIASGGTPGYSFNWPGGPATSTYAVNQTTPGVFVATVNVLDANNCPAVATKTINFIEKPNLTVNGKRSVCKGEPALIWASGASTYSWSTSQLTQSVNVAPQTTTVYSVTGTSGPCSSIASITVTVNSCTGLESENFETAKIFPNPFSTEISLVNFPSDAKIIISNYLGEVVFLADPIGEQQTIDLAHKRSGLYFVRIIHNTKSETRVLMKKD